MDYRQQNIPPPVVVNVTELGDAVYIAQLEEVCRALCLYGMAQDREDKASENLTNLAAQAAVVLQEGPRSSESVKLEITALLERALEINHEWCEVAPEYEDGEDKDLRRDLQAMITKLGVRQTEETQVASSTEETHAE